MEIKRFQTPDLGTLKHRNKIHYKTKKKDSNGKRRNLVSRFSENYSLKSPESEVTNKNRKTDPVVKYEKNLLDFGMSADEEDPMGLNSHPRSSFELQNVEEFFIKIKDLEELDTLLKKCRIYVFLIVLDKEQHLSLKLNLSENKFDDILSDNCDFLFTHLETRANNPLTAWIDPPMYRFYVRKNMVSSNKLPKNWIEAFSILLTENLKKERKKSELERKRSGSEGLLVESEFLSQNLWLQDYFCDQELMLLFVRCKKQKYKSSLDKYLYNFACSKDKVDLVRDLRSLLGQLSKHESPPLNKTRVSSGETNTHSNLGSVFTFCREKGEYTPESERKKNVRKISEFSPGIVKEVKKSGFAKLEAKKNYKFPAEVVESRKSSEKEFMNTSLERETFWMIEGMAKAVQHGKAVPRDIQRELSGIEEGNSNQGTVKNYF